MKKQAKYWYSKEYVLEIKKHLYHVWETGVTHSSCVCAFKEEDLAKCYTEYLNSN